MLLDINSNNVPSNKDKISFIQSDSVEMEELEDHISCDIIMKSDKLCSNNIQKINSSEYPSAIAASSIMFREDSNLKKGIIDILVSH